MKKTKNENKIFNLDKPVWIEPVNVVGIGKTKELKKHIVMTQVSLRCLKQIIKSTEAFLNAYSEDMADAVDVAFSEDHPLLVGKYDEKKDQFVGFAIAPRLKRDIIDWTLKEDEEEQ